MNMKTPTIAIIIPPKPSNKATPNREALFMKLPEVVWLGVVIIGVTASVASTVAVNVVLLSCVVEVAVRYGVADLVPPVRVKAVDGDWVNSGLVIVNPASLLSVGVPMGTDWAKFVSVGGDSAVAEGTVNPERVEVDFIVAVGNDAAGLWVEVLLTAELVASVGIGEPAPWVGILVFVGPEMFCST
jgi:hypothetical protein